MTSSNDSYSPRKSTCMQEVSAQQDASSVGLFRDAGCVSLPLPSFCPSPFLHPSFLLSARVSPLPPSFSVPLASWRSCPISFIPGHLSFNNGHSKLTYLSGWSETNAWRRHQHHQRSSNSADTCYACSWCSVEVRTNNNISTQTAQNYQALFCYKN